MTLTAEAAVWYSSILVQICPLWAFYQERSY